MNGHLKDLKCGGRPMTKNELKIQKLEQENQQLKNQLQQKDDIINKAKDYLIKNNLFSYKYDEEELYEIITDNKARIDLLKNIR